MFWSTAIEVKGYHRSTYNMHILVLASFSCGILTQDIAFGMETFDSMAVAVVVNLKLVTFVLIYSYRQHWYLLLK